MISFVTFPYLKELYTQPYSKTHFKFFSWDTHMPSNKAWSLKLWAPYYIVDVFTLFTCVLGFKFSFFRFSAFSNKTLNSSRLSCPSPSVSSWNILITRTWWFLIKLYLQHQSLKFLLLQLGAELLELLGGDVPAPILVKSTEGQLCPCHHLSLEYNWWSLITIL